MALLQALVLTTCEQLFARVATGVALLTTLDLSPLLATVAVDLEYLRALVALAIMTRMPTLVFEAREELRAGLSAGEARASS